MRIDPGEYRRLDLRVHALLADVPLHDVWSVDLEGPGPEQPMLALRELVSSEKLSQANVAVRLLFALRRAIGRFTPADRELPGSNESSYRHRLTAADRAASLVEPNASDGPFRALYVFPREALSEVQNRTVHAFSAFALVARPGGERFYWAIYVEPVGRITALYMGLIDPFRRLVVYPTILRRLRASWARRFAAER